MDFICFQSDAGRQKQRLTFRVSTPLAAGTYTYRTKGVYPLEGETVTVSPDKGVQRWWLSCRTSEMRNSTIISPTYMRQPRL
ncbi:hypothetical protein SFC43_27645 [Bacteroides sp. CR5/BHMF/2]|nr:hypothetical protein [Bacteroides sp. CR5/BHMF/2]